MRKVLLLVGLVAVLPAHGAVFHDSVSNLQRMIEFVVQQGNEVKKYAEMVEQARQMVAQVETTVTMMEQGARHLTNMPDGMNFLEWMGSVYTQAGAILGQVQWIGFNLDTTTQQFELLYRNVEQLTTPEGREERMRAMQEARLQMTGVSMQAQSIRQTFVGIYMRLSVLLGASTWAEGTKALQQLEMQQRALLQQQEQLALTMQAVSGRLQAMQQAEEIVRAQLDDAAAKYNAARFMDGFDTVRFRGPGEGQGFHLPK